VTLPAESVLDDQDLDLVATLQLAPRAPFDVIARALETSARTVGRRFARLVDSGILRMICEVDWALLAEGVPANVWIRTVPGRIHDVARALADRADTTYVAVSSGRGDVFCVLHGMTRAATTRALTVELPQLDGVASVQTEWVLKRLVSSASWRLPRLSAEQVEVLSPHVMPVGDGPAPGTRRDLTKFERDTAALLRQDARLPFADIARTLSISESRARRTVTAMIETGLLRPRVEIDPPRLGYAIEVVLSLGCRPDTTDAVAAKITAHPATRFLGITAGTSIMTYHGVFGCERELADFLVHGLNSFGGVTTVECSVQGEVFKRYWLAHDS
jgi:DNA-binding Lrp family transcriptional regulator